MPWRSAIFLFAALLLGSRPTSACSVGGFPKMLPSEAEVAFAGTVESVHVPALAKACGHWPASFQHAMVPFLGDVVVELRVDSVWRGFEGERAWVNFGPGCVATLGGVIGQKWLLLEYADSDTLAGEFEAGPCYFPGLLKDQGAIVKGLGTPHAPTRRLRRRSHTGLYVGSTLGVAGLLALCVWARRRRRVSAGA